MFFVTWEPSDTKSQTSEPVCFLCQVWRSSGELGRRAMGQPCDWVVINGDNSASLPRDWGRPLSPGTDPVVPLTCWGRWERRGCVYCCLTCQDAAVCPPHPRSWPMSLGRAQGLHFVPFLTELEEDRKGGGLTGVFGQEPALVSPAGSVLRFRCRSALSS